MVKKISEKIIIIGGVGTAQNIIEQIIDAAENHSVPVDLTGVIIDSIDAGNSICGVPVVGGKKEIPSLLLDKSIRFLFALYKPDSMRERFDLLQSLKIPLDRFTNFVHPLSYLAKSATMGKGNVILSSSVIQGNVNLGNFNIVNSNVTIEHDTKIGSANFFAANSCIGSHISIGNHCFIGLNSSLRENVILENNVFVGMHSLVLSNFDDVVIAGVPAKKLKIRKSENSF